MDTRHVRKTGHIIATAEKPALRFLLQGGDKPDSTPYMPPQQMPRGGVHALAADPIAHAYNEPFR